MKKMHYFLFATLMILSFSCSNNTDFVATYKNDIDGQGDWINNKTIGNYGGTTGDFSSKVDTNIEYSFGFSKLLSEISPNAIKRIKVSVSIKMANLDKKCFLVIAVNGPNNEKIYWAGHELNPIAKEVDKWYKLDVEDLMPEEYKSEGAKVGIYVWNPNKNCVFVDDYVIQFLGE